MEGRKDEDSETRSKNGDVKALMLVDPKPQPDNQEAT
jgi:hypothetical protein